MQHLIKRQTGMRAGEGLLKDKRTLAERLAEARASSKAEPVTEDFDEQHEPLELTELAPGQDNEVDIAEAVEPLADMDATDAIVRQAMAARGDDIVVPGRGKTCLVVDDSRVVRKLAGKIAAELGFTVIEAEDGKEALMRCEKSMPDLIVTDWQMPVMSGPQFVSALRALPTTKRPKVVFCTSKGEAKDIHTGIGAGADDYIVKPFAEEALKAKLAKVSAG